MRNGTRFNKLTLVDNAGSDVTGPDNESVAAYDSYDTAAQNVLIADETARAHRTFLVFLSISVTCAAATIATGTYAAWLSRHQAARQALTDVNDILKSCQSRMSQLEADLQRLPSRQE